MLRTRYDSVCRDNEFCVVRNRGSLDVFDIVSAQKGLVDYDCSPNLQKVVVWPFTPLLVSYNLVPILPSASVRIVQ